jgi:hypothetical protein
MAELVAALMEWCVPPLWDTIPMVSNPRDTIGMVSHKRRQIAHLD